MEACPRHVFLPTNTIGRDYRPWQPLASQSTACCAYLARWRLSLCGTRGENTKPGEATGSENGADSGKEDGAATRTDGRYQHAHRAGALSATVSQVLASTENTDGESSEYYGTACRMDQDRLHRFD